jgi:pimeloyl-ACP methyl ester carboxylesterase
MNLLRSPAGLGSLALAGLGTALWVEHRSREAERRHHAPHHLLYVDGKRLHYHLVGEGPPVLLVHGNLVHGADWEASGLVDRLAKRHQVLVIDRPGFGHSDRARGLAWTPARQAQLLHRAAEALGVHRPVVVGHSLGTQVALAMALQQPSSVAGLVLVSGYYWPSLRLDRWMAAPAAMPVLGDLLRYTTSALTARATLGATLKAIFDPLPVPEAFERMLPRELLLRPLQQRATAEDGSHMVAQARALRPHYATLRTPLTVIAGTEDRIVSPKQSVRLHEAVPRARLRLIDGVGHMAHYLAQEQVLAGVADALAAGAADPLVRGTAATAQVTSPPANLGQEEAPIPAFPLSEQRP